MSKFVVSEIFIDTNTKQPDHYKKNGEFGDCNHCCVIESVYTP